MLAVLSASISMSAVGVAGISVLHQCVFTSRCLPLSHNQYVFEKFIRIRSGLSLFLFEFAVGTMCIPSSLIVIVLFGSWYVYRILVVFFDLGVIEVNFEE